MVLRVRRAEFVVPAGHSVRLRERVCELERKKRRNGKLERKSRERKGMGCRTIYGPSTTGDEEGQERSRRRKNGEKDEEGWWLVRYRCGGVNENTGHPLSTSFISDARVPLDLRAGVPDVQRLFQSSSFSYLYSSTPLRNSRSILSPFFFLPTAKTLGPSLFSFSLCAPRPSRLSGLSLLGWVFPQPI